MLEEILQGMWDDEQVEVFKDRLGVYIIGLSEDVQDLFWDDLANFNVWIQNETAKRLGFKN